MGKIRTRLLGLKEVEQKQKEEQKKRTGKKKAAKPKIRGQGLKGGERMVQVEVKEEELVKMEKAKKIIESTQISQKKTTEAAEKKPKKVKAHLRGKKYQENKKLADKKKNYTVEEAVKLLKKIKYAKFDESVELHLNVDEVGLKDKVELPYATGKTIRVKIVDEKILAEIEAGKFDFDILVSHPSFMPRLAKWAKILGPRGLMPNPKAGTISEKPEEVVKKFQKGVLRWKTEAKFPLIHQMIGKISMEEKALLENAAKFLQSVGAKHIKSAFLKTTMSPAIKITI